MRTSCAKPFVALLLLFFLLGISSTSPHHDEQPSVLTSRRLLPQCSNGASPCSTTTHHLDGSSVADRFYKTPMAVFASLKGMPKSKSNPSHN
ncbi:hypothetical protein GUJ93_ZPchr0008g12745 [Zizania palustris]|uniref:Uncharacterized protein n=1 Tax=Zizania palustris TaxID=103762 RepID=A0A8J5RJW4_ZIZPA|nr:hypothetical protein GUJ93_ZPchr0008g12745 [Zizania palustris]